MAIPFPEEHKWRLLDTAEADHADDRAQVAERFARKLRRGLGRRVEVSSPSWVSVFTIQQRMVTSMREGRVLLAGDAAHVHSPASGQGLNTGIQDACNLAWKLAMVVRGHADEALLDSYSAERVPVGRALLDTTKKATALVQFKNKAASLALPVFFAVVRRLPPLRGRIERGVIGTMSALALDYADGPLTLPGPPAAPGSGTAGPLPGTRLAQVTEAQADGPAWTALLAELRDPRCTLLVSGGLLTAGEAPLRTARALHAEHADWLSVRVLLGAGGDTQRAQDAGEGDGESEGPPPGALEDPDGRLRQHLGLYPGDWMLIRPDGYLCARGTELTPEGVAPAVDTVRGRGSTPRPGPANGQAA